LILHGWLHSDMSDAEREAHGIALFDGLYRALQERLAVMEEPRPHDQAV
jgi:hypothetical protein